MMLILRSVVLLTGALGAKPAYALNKQGARPHSGGDGPRFNLAG